MTEASGGPVRNEPEILADIAKLCAEPGYVHAIAHLCLRDNSVIFSKEMKPEDIRHLFSHSRLIRTEIATLIGLLIKNEVDYTLPSPAVLSEYVKRSDALLQELHETISAPIFSNLGPVGRADANADPLSRGEALREAIFYGGESAYIFQYRDLAVKKYGGDDEWLKAHRRFAINDARSVVHAISRLQDKKLMATVRSLRGKPLEEWTVLPGFAFSTEDVAEEAGVDGDLTERILDAFTLPIAERNGRFTALNDFNVANAFPMLQMGPRERVLFHQYSLAEALYEAPFYWMGADKSYVAKAMANRGSFTEEFSKERLERVFGSANVFANVDILDGKGNKAGEIDVLVVFGSRAIVLQAKSKRLTLEARKGNEGQIRDDFKKSIQDSYDQGYECAKFLLDPSYRLTKGGVEFAITRTFKEIYILCVVADHYPVLAFQARQFLRYTSDDIVQPPFVMDVFALDAMTEMLESPLRLLSYISQRTKYSERLMAPHESTVLSYHLRHNLWLEEGQDMVLLHDDISADLDVAMAVRRDGIPGQRTPDGILTRFEATALGRLVKQIEAHPDPGTIELGFMLLTLGEDTVTETSKAIERITEQARRDRRHHDLTIGISSGSTGFTIHCNADSASVAAERLRDHCRRRKYAQKADTWFGVCVFPDKTLRFGVNLDYKWGHDPDMDRRVQGMSKGVGRGQLLATGFKRDKVGRNEQCPCGSGKKYKKCCLP